MKKRYGLFAVIALLMISVLTGCFSPWHGGEGTFSITIGGGDSGARSGFHACIPDFEHVVTLTGGPSADQKQQFTGNKTVYFSATPGKWTITVETYLDKYLNELLATGSSREEIKPGPNAPIAIEMESGKYGSFDNLFFVTNRRDYDPGAGESPITGSFRAALEDAQKRWTEITDNNENVETLLLLFSSYGGSITVTQSPIEISKDAGINLTIMGNGATLNGNKGASFVKIYPGNIKISRLHFTNGDGSFYWGGAIDNRGGNLTLESCIFSGNLGDGNYGAGSIYNDRHFDQNGTIIIKGCTFYNNTYEQIRNEAGKIILIGNLFYGNYNPNSSASVRIVNGPDDDVESLGYNVFDSDNCGWIPHATDKQIGDALPFSPANFRLFSESEVTDYTFNPATLDDYPTVDFHGNPIRYPAYAGAVQGTQGKNGKYTLNLSVKGGSERGTISPLNADGLYPSSVTFTATENEGYAFRYWLINGTERRTENPISLTLTVDNTKIEAVFTGTLIVTDNEDTKTNPLPGTLRHAIETAVEGDTISIELDGDKTIELRTYLGIYKDLTIEGNGVVITGTGEYAPGALGPLCLSLFSVTNPREHGTEYDDPQNDQTVTIRRIHFKDISMNTNGMAISNGGQYAKSIVILESCIFSGNRAHSSNTANGGAIRNNDVMVIKGCTFYNNAAYGRGGAIFNTGDMTLEGSLFYQNKKINADDYPLDNYPVVCNNDVYTSGTTTSLGYNVVDIPFGTTLGDCGWVNTTGKDKYITSRPISPDDCKLLSGSEVRLGSVTLSDGYPTVDFYGNPINKSNFAAGAAQDNAIPISITSREELERFPIT